MGGSVQWRWSGDERMDRLRAPPLEFLAARDGST